MARTLLGLQANPSFGGDVGRVGLLRTTSGVIAIDNANLTIANYPIANAIDCRGLKSIFVSLEIDGGAGPTATLGLLVYDGEATDANSGGKWKQMLVGAAAGITAIGSPATQATAALASGADFVELRVYGQIVYLRITAVANSGSTTALRIFGYPGDRF